MVLCKNLEYPLNLKCKNLNIITQYGGPDGELSATLRYLDQRYTIPTGKANAILTDVGTDATIT